MAPRMVVRRGGFSRPRGARRQTTWIASADITAPTTLSGGVAVLDQSFTEAQIAFLGPFTVTRTVGWLAVRGDTLSQSEDQLVAVGAAVVSEQARAAGIASLPTPITDEESDLFFLYDSVVGGFDLLTAVGMSNQSWTIRYFDSRAQRKVQSDGEGVVWTVENSLATGLEYMLKFRMLVKLN